ncbi:MAG: hypothetical protein AAFU85_23505 [Planctomycetota bacterium]
MEIALPKRMEVFIPTSYVSEVDDLDLCSVVYQKEKRIERREAISVSLEGDSFCWQNGRWLTRIRRDSISSAAVTDEMIGFHRCQSFTMHFGHHPRGPMTLLCMYADATEWFSEFATSIARFLPCPIANAQRTPDGPITH